MAISEHLAILREGSTVWNRWRKANPDVVPDLTGVTLERASLASADLNHCRLTGSKFQEAMFSGANLVAADLTDANFLAADLSGADFSGANLSNAVLFQANVRDALLNAAKLYGAELRRANFAEASFLNADLTVADLRAANLSGAKFGGADLGGTNLVGAIVSGADFTDAIIWETILGSLDLSTAIGLDRVKHRGPSILGIDTLFQSNGEIPEVFLRGCGVPERFISYVHQLVGKPVEFHSCFLSYSTEDEEFVQRLYTDLQARGVRCWFAPQDIRGGQRLHEQINNAIQLADRVLLVISEASMKSEWVKVEIAKARQREMIERRQILFPISIVPFDLLRHWSAFDAESGKDSAREVREYFIPDFSNWKDRDAYVRASSRLLKDIVTSAELGIRSGGGRE
jgi:uncharacterized protein YjbI with pentapeptide repeats